MTYDILIVDDSDVIRAMIRKTLKLAEIPVARCYEAANGQEALAVMDEHWVDVVLADLNMPVMDGHELLRVMRASRILSAVPVIVVSSESMPAELLVGDPGISAYVRKPFTPEQIRDALVDLLGQMDRAVEPAWLLEQFAVALETMAFMFADPAEETVPHVEGDFVHAAMVFSGGACGGMTLSVPRQLAVRMAAQALGIDDGDEVAAQNAGDVVAELLNITCGHVAETVAAGGEVDLEPPVVSEHDGSRWGELACGPVTASCLVEGQPVTVTVGVRTRGSR